MRCPATYCICQLDRTGLKGLMVEGGYMDMSECVNRAADIAESMPAINCATVVIYEQRGGYNYGPALVTALPAAPQRAGEW